MIWNKYLKITILFTLFSISGCAVRMTMNGSSIPENIKTCSVQYFDNRAPLVNPQLSQQFTEALKDKISRESRLIVRDTRGDVDFSGTITGYNITATAIQSNAQAAMNRLTITVKVKYQSYKNPKDNWEQSFTAYEEFESSQNISTVESNLVKLINDKLTENIFNKAFSNW